MSRIMLAIVCCALVSGACKQSPKHREPQVFSEERAMQPVPAPEPDNSIEAQRLIHIRKLFRSSPIMKFPFHRKTQGSQELEHFSVVKDRDTLLFDPNHMAASIIGTLPDTSRYFGVFYLSEADDLLLTFLAVDKSGRIIEREILVESCWQGGESDCISLTDITADLTIRFDYSEFLFPEDGEDSYGSVPDKASGYVTTSKITPSGKIKLVKRTEKDPAELLEHPMVH
jgi:hypothetical protein